MGTREISDGHYGWLVGELESWADSGLISDDQSDRILGLYASSEERAARRSERSIGTLMVLAALLVGLAVFLIVAFNWDEMPAAAKLTTLFTTLGATHGLGLLLRYRWGKRSASDIVFFLGCLFYGAAIALIAQIFHINVQDASGYWWWGVGVLPFALVLGTTPIHALLVAILCYYTGATVLGAFWWRGPFGFWGGFSASALSVPPLAGLGILWAYWRGSPRILGLYVGLIAFWVVMQPFAWRFDDAPLCWIGATGALLMLIAECHAPRDEMALPYRFFGVALAGGVLMPLAVYDFNRHIIRNVVPVNLSIEMAAALVSGALLMIVIADLDRRRTGRERSLWEAVVEERGRWFPRALLLFFGLVGLWKAGVGEPLVTTIGANFAMVALAFWLMRSGLNEDRGKPFAVGVAYFLIWAVSRYIDLFGDFGGMPGAALMFFLCGAALFGVARFWSTRKVAQHV